MDFSLSPEQEEMQRVAAEGDRPTGGRGADDDQDQVIQ